MNGNLADVDLDVARRADVGAADGLAALDAAARDSARHDRPDNTASAYASDMRVWQEFCAEYNVDPAMVSEGLLSAFVLWLDETREAAVSVLRRRVYGVVISLRDQHGVTQVPVGISRLANSKIAAIERELAIARVTRGRGEAVEIQPDELRAVCVAQPDTLYGLRTRALLVMSAYLGTRVSETVALHGPDIVGDETFLRAHVRWSKTKAKMPVLSAKPGNDLCPVSLWHQWRSAAGVTDGPAFPAMDRHGNVYLDRALSPRTAERVFHGAALAAGLDPWLVTGHSFRAFMATQAYLGGASIREIADQGGWSPTSRSLWRYIRRAEEQKRNATTAFEF